LEEVYFIFEDGFGIKKSQELRKEKAEMGKRAVEREL
jgi:hypothetical protein